MYEDITKLFGFEDVEAPMCQAANFETAAVDPEMRSPDPPLL